MKKIWRKIILAGVALLLLPIALIVGSENNLVAAADNDMVDYSVAPILPDSQRDRGNTYFDLLVKPDTTQTVKVQINNFAKKEQKFAINVNTAQTNGNLKIDYTQTKNVAGTIGDLADYPKMVTIPAEKAGIVSIKIKVPAEKFAGIMLGGIQVKKVNEKKASAENEIVSDYDYVIGLTLAEDEKEVEPDLQFVDVKTDVISNNAGLTVELKNPTPINISKVVMTGNVFKAGQENKPVISRTIKNGGIAPNSQFKLNFFNGESGATKPLEAGDYTLQLDFADEKGRTWKFNKEFTITKKDAAVVNNKVFVVKKDNTMLFIVIGILLAVIVVGLIWFIIVGRRKKKKEEEE